MRTCTSSSPQEDVMGRNDHEKNKVPHCHRKHAHPRTPKARLESLIMSIPSVDDRRGVPARIRYVGERNPWNHSHFSRVFWLAA